MAPSDLQIAANHIEEAVDESRFESVPFEAYEQTESRRRLYFLSYSEMIAMPEPEWLVHGVIQKRSAALMFGKSNVYKSFLAIDLALSAQTGRDWHGHAVVPGNVLFVATEGANGVGRLRIPAWYDHHGIPMESRTARLYPQEIALDNSANITDLVSEMKRSGGFALVVVDIFGGSMNGSEIEDKTARAWVHGIQRIIRESGAAVLTVAHTGWQDDSRARMHTHFWGSFDTRLRVEGDKNALTSSMTVERHKDADSAGTWGFRMIKTGDSLVPELDAAVKPLKTQGLTVAQRTALSALDDALVASGVRKTGADWPATDVVLVEQWRSHFYRHSVSDTVEAKKKAFQRARDDLNKKGVIAFYDDHVWRCFDA